MRKIIKNVTPDYNINFAWKTIKMESLISPLLKYNKPTLSKHNIVYEFKCECGDKYIGETKQQLLDRIRQHNTNNSKTGGTIVYKHIQNCQTFKEKRTNDIPLSQTNKEKFSYFKDHFKIVGSNYRTLRQRKVTEAIFIKIKKPKLNIQIDFNTTEKFGKPTTLKLI